MVNEQLNTFLSEHGFLFPSDNLNYLSEKNKHGFTPMVLASINARWPLLETMIIDLTHSENLNDSPGAGHTLLYAILSNKMDLISKLLKLNHISMTEYFRSGDHHGMGALHLAVEQKNYELAQLLLDKGFDINARYRLERDYGPSPIHLAMYNDDAKMIKLLASHGADLTYNIGKDKVTALTWAACNEDWDLVNLITDKAHGINNEGDLLDAGRALFLILKENQSTLANKLMSKVPISTFNLSWNENGIDVRVLLIKNGMGVTAKKTFICPDGLFKRHNRGDEKSIPKTDIKSPVDQDDETQFKLELGN